MKTKGGFTLIEFMIVMMLFAILLTVGVGVYITRLNKSSDNTGNVGFPVITTPTASAVSTVDEITPTPTPTAVSTVHAIITTPMPSVAPIIGGLGASAAPGGFACAPPDMFGVSYCKSYGNPKASGCPKTYATWPCNNDCQTHPEVRCTQ